MNIVFSSTVFGESVYNFSKWKGVIYQNCELRGITSDADFVASVSNISLSIEDEEFYNVIKGAGIELTETSMTSEISALNSWYVPYHEGYNQQPVVVIEENLDIESSELITLLSQLRYSVGVILITIMKFIVQMRPL